MGGLRKELDLCSQEEDVCGFWVWWVLIEEFVAIGLMRPTANGSSFLGCRGWIWVVCVKLVV